MKRNILSFCILLILINAKAYGFPKLISLTDQASMDSIPLREYQLDENIIFFSHKININLDAFFYSDTVEIQLDGEDLVVTKNYAISEEGLDYMFNSYENNFAHIFISKLGNDIQGSISAPSGTYNIETSMGNYLLEKLNIDEIPDDAPPISPSDVSKEILTRSSNDTAYIRVLIMYTSGALLINPNMINKIYLDINKANASFHNSNIKARLEIAYIGHTTDSEYGLTYNQLLEKFKNNGDGMFDDVHTLRGKYHADVCVLLDSLSGFCGMSYIGANNDYAFAVVNARSGCAKKYSFAHEIGHIIGCGHDMDAPTHDSPCAYGHGFVHYIVGDTVSSWRTMMAYGTACADYEPNCKRIPYWSNPNISYNGTLTGNVTQCNNARVWNENASNVSNFTSDPLSWVITHLDNSTSMAYAHWRTTQTIITSNGYVVDSGQVVKMTAANMIQLRPNTTIKPGSKFAATTDIGYPSNDYPHFLVSRLEPVSDVQGIVSIFPNPAITEVNINLNLREEKMQCVSISVLDISGEQQIQILHNICMNTPKTSTINVTNLAAGIYFIVTNIDGVSYINKFIKQ